MSTVPQVINISPYDSQGCSRINTTGTSDPSIKVKAYTFDWDDNIIHMPSTARVYFDVPDNLKGPITQYMQTIHSNEISPNFNPEIHNFNDFIAYLEPNQVYKIDLSKINIPNVAPFDIVNLTSCCSDYVKTTDEKKHSTRQSPPPLPDPTLTRPDYCIWCVGACIAKVVTTAQYAEVRQTCRRKGDTYESFKLASSFFKCMFQACTSPSLSPLDVISDEPTRLDGNQQSVGETKGDRNPTIVSQDDLYGFLPRNKAVLESLYYSYLDAKEQVELEKKLSEKNVTKPTKHADYLGLLEQQRQTQAQRTKAGLNMLNYLDLFSCYNFPTTAPMTTDEDQNAQPSLDHDVIDASFTPVPPEDVVKNLKWMFESQYSPPILNLIKPTSTSSPSPQPPPQSKPQSQSIHDLVFNDLPLNTNTLLTSQIEQLYQFNSNSQTNTDINEKNLPYGHFFPFQSFGPSLGRFLDSILLHNHPIAIITARGQPSWVLQRAILALILYFFTEEQFELVKKHVFSAKSHCLCEYISHIPVFGVHSPAFLNWVWSEQPEHNGIDSNCELMSEQIQQKDPKNVKQLKEEVYQVLKPEQPKSPEVYKCIAMASYLKRLVGTDYTILAKTACLISDDDYENEKINKQDPHPESNEDWLTTATPRWNIAGLDHTFTMGIPGLIPQQPEIYHRLQNKCFCNQPIYTTNQLESPNIDQISTQPSQDDLPIPPITPTPPLENLLQIGLPSTSSLRLREQPQNHHVLDSIPSNHENKNSNPIAQIEDNSTDHSPIQEDQSQTAIKYQYSLGFSDDDPHNVAAMINYFQHGLREIYPQVKFVVYDTSKRGILTKQVID